MIYVIGREYKVSGTFKLLLKKVINKKCIATISLYAFG